MGSGGRTLDGKVLTDRQGTQHARRKRHEHFISKLRCLMLNQKEGTWSIFLRHTPDQTTKQQQRTHDNAQRTAETHPLDSMFSLTLARSRPANRSPYTATRPYTAFVRHLTT